MPDFGLPGEMIKKIGARLPFSQGKNRCQICKQQKLQKSELVNSARISEDNAKRYFCAGSFLLEKGARL